MKKIYLPGDDICEIEGYIKGHGTEIYNKRIISNHLGTVSQINKLITVYPLFSIRYTPEIGDVIVGRVMQIYNKKWKLDTNSKSDTTLSLSAINLPGSIQRRKSEDDEINMSNYFDINDVLVCEVQKVNKNGGAALHTRSDKYGKLTNGVLVCVPPSKIISMKSRFLSKESIEIVCGCNGFIWISSKEYTCDSLKKLVQLKLAIEECYKHNDTIDIEKILNQIF